MKQILPGLILTLLVLVAFFTGCASTPQNPQLPVTGTPALKTYIVGIDAEYPPYSYLES